MMKRLIPLLLLLLALPATARAQQQSCDLGNSRQLYSVGGGAVVYVGGPVFVCDSGTRILADSAVYVQATGRIDFIGNVRFNETERALTSMYAQYIGRERRLMAQQNVVLTDKRDGSTLRALSLDYFQKSGANPESRIEVYSGRPRATLYRQRAEAPGVRDTTIVDADQMSIRGENVFIGRGAVDVKRGKLTAKSTYAEFDQNGSYMKLYGRATVQSDTFSLSADSIDAELVNGDEFRSVHARQDAKLASRTMDVAAPVVRIRFEAGAVERLIAIGGGRTGRLAPQARATSENFTLIADSIDAVTPAQRLDRVTAVGAALGETRPDSADVDLPPLIAKDWVRGDTVIAHFTSAPDTAGRGRGVAPDSARVLERILARGVPASSTYKLRETVDDSVTTSINYITARSIDVKFRNGEVDEVRAEGDIRGVYLQPPRRETVAREGSD